jgi:hypothetical protein
MSTLLPNDAGGDKGAGLPSTCAATNDRHGRPGCPLRRELQSRIQENRKTITDGVKLFAQASRDAFRLGLPIGFVDLFEMVFGVEYLDRLVCEAAAARAQNAAKQPPPPSPEERRARERFANLLRAVDEATDEEVALLFRRRSVRRALDDRVRLLLSTELPGALDFLLERRKRP